MLGLLTLDARGPGFKSAMEELRKLQDKLSPKGDVITESAKRITMEVFGKEIPPNEVVNIICNEVKAKGFQAVQEFTRHLDQTEVYDRNFRVDPLELEAAHSMADKSYLESIARIRDNIKKFQSKILHQGRVFNREPGVTFRHRYQPLKRIGVCVPGGAAAYPSSLLMSAVPAQVAGVQEIAVVAPPTEFGSHNNDLLAACHEIGIKEVYRVGGVQAVAALAFGLGENLPQVDKIVGPGNQYVSLAKKHVYGHVDIDSIAGPSEVVVIADQSANPEWVALDLLSQAEHYPGAAVLVTWSENLADNVFTELDKKIAKLKRGDKAKQCLEQYGAVIIADDWQQAAKISDVLAPEHLHLETEHDDELVDACRNAGAIFKGHITPVAMGDYAAGPSHVLPTGGTARWASGLTCNDFLRSHTVIEYSEIGLANDAPDVIQISEVEGLTAHQESVLCRVTE